MPLFLTPSCPATPAASRPDGEYPLHRGRLLLLDFPPDDRKELGAVLARESYQFDACPAADLEKNRDLSGYDLVVVKSGQPPRQYLEALGRQHPELPEAYVMFATEGIPSPPQVRESYQYGHGDLHFPMTEHQFLQIVQWSVESSHQARMEEQETKEPLWLRVKTAFRENALMVLAAIVGAVLLALAIQFITSQRYGRNTFKESIMFRLFNKEIK